MVNHVGPDVRAVVINRLRQRREDGRLSNVDVRVAAAGLAVTERTVWRWLRADGLGSPRPGRERYQLTEADRDAYADWRGNVAAMHRARVEAGEAGVPTLRTLQRAFAAELTAGERAAVSDGVEGRRRHEVYLRHEPVKRNAVWEGDHKELPVLVTPPRGVRPVKPWVTLFLDGYSRLVMGWALSLRPDAATVLATLCGGLVVDPERGPFGGVPDVLRPDNGLEFINTALARVCGVLGVELAPTPKFTPHRKGKVERVNRTVDQEFLSGLPFYTKGPRDAAGRLFGPDVAPMALSLFVEHFTAWVHEYNTVRLHSQLAGQTPLQRWCADASPVRQIAAGELRWLLLADVERTIQKDGVHFGALSFLAAELNGRVGERVQVRYMPHDLRQIEIFRGDDWLCTAHPQHLLSDEQRDAVLARRRADVAELGRRQRRASRRARARLAPITGPGPVTDTTTVSAEQAAADDTADCEGPGGGRHGDRDRNLRRLGLTTLLNLRDDFEYWNPTADLDAVASPAVTGQATGGATEGER
ncbi:MAG: Mu transposase C-terminal domain-containing protein [Pseudonocardia sp.]